MWASFAPTAAYTIPVAAHLVEFAEIKTGEVVLGAGTDTGVVAITAARRGASVTGLNLTPALLDAACENARTASLGAIQWVEGDAGTFPLPMASSTSSSVSSATCLRRDWRFAVVGRNSPPPPPELRHLRNRETQELWLGA